MSEGLSLPIDLDRLQEWLLNSALAEHAEVIVAATQAVLRMNHWLIRSSACHRGAKGLSNLVM